MSALASRPSAWLDDSSALHRIGVKGPGAAAWLQERSVALPDAANTWNALSGTGDDIVVRLGWSEYLIEQAGAGDLVARLEHDVAIPLEGVYPVLREDCALVLGGAAANEVLAEVCNVNFGALPERAAVMTMMIGVAVTVVPQGNAAQRRYRIWCDPTFGSYLRSSLLDVVREQSERSEEVEHGGE